EALMRVIEAKLEGVEVEAPEPVEEGTKIVDLMKLLEDSVKAATDARSKGGEEPVSVEEAKKAREKRPARRPAAKAKEEAKPARRRKTA
ncbi:MAG TPA: hypothetical protein VH813_08970, partial [Candidatus Limnocylindrales bacterium]